MANVTRLFKKQIKNKDCDNCRLLYELMILLHNITEEYEIIENELKRLQKNKYSNKK